MSFLTGEDIKQISKQNIITNEYGVSIFKDDNIDCNSYSLSIGREVVVTHENEKKRKKIKIDERQEFTIPSGQFALILTEEVVYIPNKYMGLISITSDIKFRGLINISGFHVDPGYNGRLLFSVYNAGPKSISLRQGDTIFKLWLSELTNKTNILHEKDDKRLDIRSEYIGYLKGQVYSPHSVVKKTRRLIKNQYFYFFGILISFILGVLITITQDAYRTYIAYDNKQEIINIIKNELNKHKN